MTKLLTVFVNCCCCLDEFRSWLILQMMKGMMSGKRKLDGDEKEDLTGVLSVCWILRQFYTCMCTMHTIDQVLIMSELCNWAFFVSAPKKMEILELEDIEKEFMLVDARLQLLKHDTTNSVGSGWWHQHAKCIMGIEHIQCLYWIIVLLSTENLLGSSLWLSLLRSYSWPWWDGGVAGECWDVRPSTNNLSVVWNEVDVCFWQPGIKVQYAVVSLDHLSFKSVLEISNHPSWN